MMRKFLIIFNLLLWTGIIASAQTTLLRGPYLQMGTSSGVTIRWRTDIAADSKVSYGTVAGSLTSTASVAASVTEHEVSLTGLTPNTKYYYSIGSSTQTLQGDVNNFFLTAPPIGTQQKTRIWLTGDCGNNSTNQKSVRDKYQAYLGTNNTDVWLLAGDNAYNAGTDAEYQSNFFNIYKDKMLKQTVLWPAPGNHDYANNGTRQNDHNIPYYDHFSLPTNGEVGGVPSNTEAFYSFNYANIHFVALDSYGKELNSYRLYDTLGPQTVWLKNDLAANTQKWTIVYFHHPPYTMGSHNSDTESELYTMRQKFIRILERYKVDMIICGHSHSYERTKLIKGHYGDESTFNAATHNLSTSSGKYDGSANSCPYQKNVSTNYEGSIYVVSGSSGSLGGTQAAFPHNAMHFSDATNGGGLIIEIDQNRLDSKWLCADGVMRDQFTVFKDVNKTTNITINQGQSATLTASWVGNYSWSTGATTKSITVSPTTTTTYTCQDNFSCVTDVFNVINTGNVAPTVSMTAPANNALYPSVPATVTITATAADADGTVSKVEFYNGATLLGTSTTSPYTYSWTSVATGTYSLTAKAYDNLGATTTSSVITIIAGNQNPTVFITSPANNATFGQPASVIINATAADPDGTISKVEFYNGATLLGNDLTSPYSYTWSGVAPGTYPLTAKAYDNTTGVATSTIVYITVTNQNPTVSITSPANNATFTVPTNVTITATAADGDGTINKVEFYNGTTLLGTSTTSPYTYNWTSVAPGTYSLSARAYDNNGAITSSSSITITVTMACTPVTGTTFGTGPAYSVGSEYDKAFDGNINTYDDDLTASGGYTGFDLGTAQVVTGIRYYPRSGNAGRMTGGKFQGSNTSSSAGFVDLYTIPTTPTYAWQDVSIINSTAYRYYRYLGPTNGYTNVAEIQFCGSGNAAPTVSITSPANNATFTAPANVAIAATAADADGTINKVEFYNGATLLGTSTTSPYAYNWTSVAAGTYSLTAKAYDNSGAITTSSVITVIVNTTSTSTIVPMSGSWKYLDNGTDQGTAWYGTGFNDASWASGNAQLGYGDGDEATVVSYGGNASAKYTTTYFRKTVSVADASLYSSYTLNVRRDDGIVVYINGVEKYRDNMPVGPIAYNTWASTACSDDGTSILTATLPSGSLVTGTNVIAVEIHQNAGNSSDISFDLELIGQNATTPTVNFTNATKVYGDVPFAMTATSNSPGAMSYSITSGASFASINASTGQVTILGAGTVTVQVSQAASGFYTAATQNATLTINKATLTATANNQSRVYNTANPALTITYSGFVNGDNATVVTTAPTASTTAITTSNVGTYPITLTGGAASNYTITLVNGALTITPATPTLTYTGPNAGTVGSVLALTATTNSTATPTYSVSNGTGTATLVGSNLTLNTAGTVTVTVSVAANGNYATATVNQTITINNLTTPTITYNGATKIYGDVPFAMTASSNSPGAMTYSITSGSSFASINASTGQVTILGAGTVTVQVAQAASGSYAAATQTATLTINKAILTATATNQTRVYNTANPAFTITYTGFVNGDNASVVTTAPATSTTGTISSNVGTYPITLSGGTAGNYNITLANGTLSITPATPTLTYTGPTSGAVDATITMTATTNSTATPTFSVANGTGTATLSGADLTLNTAGTVTVTVSVAATANYTAATVNQTIIINTLPDATVNAAFGTSGVVGQVIALGIVTNSTGTVTYSVTNGTGSATLSATQLTLTSVGTVTVTVTITSDGTYATTTFSQTINISNVTSVANAENTGFRVYPSVVENVATMEFKNLENGVISITNSIGVEQSIINYRGESEIKLDVANWASGVYVIKLQTLSGEKVTKLIKQ